MMNIKIMRILYDFFTYLIFPLLLLHIIIRAFVDRNYIYRVSERFGFYTQNIKGEVIWVHSVSFGEVKAASPLVRELIKAYPSKQILFTCTTPTGSKLINDLFGEEVINVYLPYDLRGSVNRFFRWANPQVAIIVETEIWPNIFQRCGYNNIPLVLASACISDRSLKLYKLLFDLFKDTVSQGIVVGAQTESDAKKFLELGAKQERTFITGNIKFDFSPSESILQEANHFKLEHFKDRQVWIGGSTHPGEEELILESHKQVLKRYPESLLLIAPRKPERFKAVYKLIIDSNLTSSRWSEFESLDPKVNVLLIDTLGDLPFFYSAADMAFVGGSLFSVGGHNLLEPASLGKPVITGPILHNVEEISSQLLINDGLAVINNSTELAETIITLFDDSSKIDTMVSGAMDVMKDNRGAIENILQLIKPLIKT
ncbi:MAG: lipid IV(A) 3-deoxy-D-manno-octulosonic acid transferase [Gammaproteobacteria bacterium]